jgi:oligoribonuclease NrnB/cAMP/cGMP phosphodiesterase (DHH superfamily)
MNNSKIHVFTDADLDGCVSYLTLCWFFNKKLPVTVTTEKNFESDFTSFTQKNNLDNYSRIYVLDISVTKHAHLLDRENITIVDHHQESFNKEDLFSKARVLFKDEGSTCRLLYTKLKDSFKVDLDKPKKVLISLGHDYDSYELKFKELSMGLNTLFWNLQGDRNEKFSTKFFEGFSGFSSDDVKVISFYKNKIKAHIEANQIFYSDINIGGKIVKVSSIFADFCINEIAQEIIDRAKSDVGIVVNLRTESVSFRRSKNCTVNMGTLSEKLCNGGGHEAAAGGKLTNSFMEFTKLLTKIL